MSRQVRYFYSDTAWRPLPQAPSGYGKILPGKRHSRWKYRASVRRIGAAAPSRFETGNSVPPFFPARREHHAERIPTGTPIKGAKENSTIFASLWSVIRESGAPLVTTPRYSPVAETAMTRNTTVMNIDAAYKSNTAVSLPMRLDPLLP